MEGMRLVQLCRNLRDTTSQNNPTSLINHTGCNQMIFTRNNVIFFCPHPWPLTEYMATRLAPFMPSLRNLSPIPGRGGSNKEAGNLGFGLREDGW